MRDSNDRVSLQTRRLQAQAGLVRGEIPALMLGNNLKWFQPIALALFVGIAVALAVYLVGWFLSVQNLHSWAKRLASLAFSFVLVFPFVFLLFASLRYRVLPDLRLMRFFSPWHRLFASVTLAYWIVLLLRNYHWLSIEMLSTVQKSKPFLTPSFWLWLGLSVFFLGLAFLPAYFHRTGRGKKKPAHAAFGVWLGESTGQLAKLSHKANIAGKQQVGLFGDDLAQNVLVLGAIGSGKTTRAIHPLLLQLLEQQCGGLIFDIKGDFHQAVAQCAAITGRSYQIIGVGQLTLNVLAGLTPEMAASFLKSTFLLGGSPQESFWIDTATEFCRNVLGVLSFLPEHYNLASLYRYIFDASFHNQQWLKVEALADTLSARDKQLLDSYQLYENSVLTSFDEKVLRSVKATLAQILSPFQHPDLIAAFCTQPEEDASQANLEAILEGNVFLVHLPLSQWGLGARIVYMLVKLRFFNIMQQRHTHTDWNQSRYAFFICDEYQEIISANKDGLSDLNFWDKSRSSKTLGIISAQSVSSFYAAIGHRDVAQAVIQNFRQKLCFRTEDHNTIALFNQLLGTVQVARITTSRSKSKTTKLLEKSSKTKGSSQSLSVHDKPLLDGQFFRNLAVNQALAVLSVQGEGFDDVLMMQPFFVKNKSC
jgi:type IV secretory pathway TraG/TraD family ATPase VirD4